MAYLIYRPRKVQLPLPKIVGDRLGGRAKMMREKIPLALGLTTKYVTIIDGLAVRGLATEVVNNRESH